MGSLHITKEIKEYVKNLYFHLLFKDTYKTRFLVIDDCLLSNAGPES